MAAAAPRAVLTAVIVVCTAAGASAGMAWERVRQPATASVPAEGSADAGFARDMREHHAQAVQMSVLVRDATTDPQIRTLALDVLLTQQQQVGQLYGWLSAWGLPQTSPQAPMRWMRPAAQATAATPDPAGGHGAGHPAAATAGPGAAAAMPGMAGPAELARLARLRGNAAERFYLQLMIPHHQGGVAMATAAVAQARTPQVRALARGIAAAQTAELGALQQMLTARGGPLLPP